MSFRSKVALATAVAVAVSVWVVALAVTSLITNTFERRDAERTAAFLDQFHREFASRGIDIARRVEAIAGSADLARIAAAAAEPAPDTSQFLNDAAGLAQEQSLDLLSIAGPDTALISSAHWPARFGYKEEWLAQQRDAQPSAAFLKREELADGTETIGLFAVRKVRSAVGPIYVAGGQRVSQTFLQSFILPPGMTLELWDSKARAPRAGLSMDGSRMLSVIPLETPDGQALGSLVAANSRADLLSLVAYTRYIAMVVGLAGVLFGVGLSWWVATRVTAPVRILASSVREVAGGNWDARANIQSSDEIGRLAADFNQMTLELIEQKQRMVQSERVAAWRELARRLAHELKNPLFPLQLTVENLQRARAAKSADFDEIFEESTSTLLAELQNLKVIIGRFSDFAKMPAPQLEPVDINALVTEVERFYTPQFGTSITPVLEFDPTLPPVQADADQLRRALRNLVLNAIDAMPRGGTLTLRTATAAGRALIEVKDTGEGLTPEECERLFTPYYTTKTHGTGLGLAIVQSVVSDHHGAIRVESDPSRGTTFHIDLPLTP